MRFLFTVDVERDPFMSGAPSFRGASEGLPRLLDILRLHDIRSTMFVSGEVAMVVPEVIRRIRADGHEIGCHGFDHSLGHLNRRSLKDVREDVTKGRTAVAETSGRPPLVFRAPNFGVDATVLGEVVQSGFEVDSSVLPGRVVRRWRILPQVDHRGAPIEPYRPREDDYRCTGGTSIVEVPVTPNPNTPGGTLGLGYLNAFGTAVTLKAFSRVRGPYLMMVSHPWEAIDLVETCPRAPAWAHSACRLDMTRLAELFAHVRESHESGTVLEEARLWAVRGE